MVGILELHDKIILCTLQILTFHGASDQLNPFEDNVAF